MIYPKHVLLYSIWIGSMSFNFHRVLRLSDIFSWYLCTRCSSRIFPLLPPSRKSRIFSRASICLFCLMLMKRSSMDFAILDFPKFFVTLYMIQQNVTFVWCHSHKSYLLQYLNVSAHHRVTVWTSRYQQPFYWNKNANARGGEAADWSSKEE